VLKAHGEKIATKDHRAPRIALLSALLMTLDLFWAQCAAPLPLNRSVEEYRHRENVAIGEVAAFAQPPGSGLDNDWQDVGVRQQAFCTNLNPGHYMFSVVASNNDGLWPPRGAQVTIIIPPAFTQTGAFAVLSIFGIVALIGFLLRIRVRQASMLRERHEARLAERDRIARDLHDTLLQSTEGLILKVYTAAQQLPPGDPTRAFLTRSVDQAEELAIEGRQKLLGLRRPSQSRLELSQALAALGLELSAHTTTTFSAVKKGRVRGLAAATWDEVFSIAREAINNAFRHAAADHIEAVFTYGSSALTVRIRDDGRGVPKEVSLLSGKPGHFGLRAMRERAEQLHAELVIGTGADRGTTVSLVVPGSVAYHCRPSLRTKALRVTCGPRPNGETV